MWEQRIIDGEIEMYTIQSFWTLCISKYTLEYNFVAFVNNKLTLAIIWS